jgi:hypothetical protein
MLRARTSSWRCGVQMEKAMMQTSQPSFALGRDAVEAVVQRATHPQAVQVTGWDVGTLSGGRETVSSIYHVDVSVWFQESRRSSTLRFILKIIRRTADRLSPQHWNYWRREAEAYRSGALAALPAGLSAPACYGVTAHEGMVWIWLEYAGQPDAPWSEDTIGYVACELGRFNGSYLAETPLPTGAWLSRGWLRHYVNTYAASIERLPMLRAHPLAGRAVAPHLLSDLLGLVNEREHWLALLDGLPQVFCHQDAHRGNLFITGTRTNDARLVAVDWSFAGIAALGQELAPLLFTNRRVPNIYELATRQYVAGLRDAGWRGDEAMIGWSSAIAAALIYGVAMVGMFLDNLLDEREHPALEEGFGVTIEELPPRATAWVEFGLHAADVARRAVTAV